MTAPAPPKVNFGIDSPNFVFAFIVLAVLTLPLAVTAGATSGIGGAITPLIVAGLFGGAAAYMVRGSRKGKPALWREQLDELDLAGNEEVLDLGCGPGLVTVMLAQRLPEGHVVGVDMWIKAHHTVNRHHVAETNAWSSGVGDRVEIVDANLIEPLPFDGATFDLVVASMSMHHLPLADQRRDLAHEIARVLRPGGRVVVIDNMRTANIEAQLDDAQLFNVQRSKARWATYPPSRIVTASKPAKTSKKR